MPRRPAVVDLVEQQAAAPPAREDRPAFGDDTRRSRRTVTRAPDVLSGTWLGRLRSRVRLTVSLMGPAFIAAVAFVDPGNVATNVSAGARHGYTLVWVVVLANMMAMLVQYLSAKLGIVADESLAGLLGQRLPTASRILYWLQAEVIAAATDLAEVVGGAIALALLFNLSLAIGAVCTTLGSLVMLRIGDLGGQRALERAVIALLIIIAIGFLAGLVVDPPAARPFLGGLAPRFDGSDSVLLATGMIGATVMPHAIYLHSSLTARRTVGGSVGHDVESRLRGTRTDVIVALAVAGVLNMALLVMASNSLYQLPGTDTLDGVYTVVTSRFGAGVALLFATALLSSGLASTSVGCAAGAEVMRGLLHRRVPQALRRTLTAAPAVIALLIGFNPTRTLVLSQVLLSVGLPFALVPLVYFTSSRSIMGQHANGRLTIAAAVTIAAAITLVNIVLFSSL